LDGSLHEETIARAFASSDPDEREVALELAEPRLAGAPMLIERALPLANDPNAHVRFRFALCVGGIDDQRIASALGSIAGRDHDDRWIRAAALSGATHHWDSFLAAVIATDRHAPARMLDLLAECGRLLPKNELENNAARIAQTVRGLTAESAADVQVALLTGMADAHGLSLDAKWQPLPELVHREIGIATTPHGDVARRILSVRFLGHTTLPKADAALRNVARNGSDFGLRLAALTAMPEASAASVLAELFTQERWNALPPEARGSLLAFAASRPAFIGALLNAAENGKLPRNAIDTTRRQQFLKHKTAEIQKRAEALFGQPMEGDRRAAFEAAKVALKMRGDGLRGRAVFQKTCATCHRLDREGYAVGPDLFDIRNQPKESILLHIVVPDHEIAPAFAAYLVETTDGRTLQGIMESESADSVTLREPQDVHETLLRSKIASITASPTSLMPAGLEQTMTAQELADLLAYLKGEQ
jgi:putative heme-binding domain-containing protein